MVHFTAAVYTSWRRPQPAPTRLPSGCRQPNQPTTRNKGAQGASSHDAKTRQSTPDAGLCPLRAGRNLFAATRLLVQTIHPNHRRPLDERWRAIPKRSRGLRAPPRHRHHLDRPQRRLNSRRPHQERSHIQVRHAAKTSLTANATRKARLTPPHPPGDESGSAGRKRQRPIGAPQSTARSRDKQKTRNRSREHPRTRST